MNRILILARNFREAQMLARRYELPPLEWLYVADDGAFRGRHKAHVIATQCWSDGRRGYEALRIWDALRYWPIKPLVAWVECP